MPYINSEDGRREALQRGEPALLAGELNYQIFYYIKHNTALSELNQKYQVERFVKQFLGKKPNYQRYNDMTGCLVRCYKEIERRLEIYPSFLFDILKNYDDEIAKYEDIKCNTNGDVE